MKPSTPDFVQIELLVGAAETEDDLGTVLRLHLAMEQLLNIYLLQKIDDEIKPYVQTPREFARKLGIAVAFGFPVVIAAGFHQINRMRNNLAHGNTYSLDKDNVAELVRKANRIVEIDTDFKPVETIYIELAKKNPGERVTLGQRGERFDFLIAAMSLYTSTAKWLFLSFPELAQKVIEDSAAPTMG